MRASIGDVEWGKGAAARRGLLEGDRVRFRPLQEEDLPKLVGWRRDPRWTVLQQLVIRSRPDAEIYDEVLMSVLARMGSGRSTTA